MCLLHNRFSLTHTPRHFVFSFIQDGTVMNRCQNNLWTLSMYSDLILMSNSNVCNSSPYCLFPLYLSCDCFVHMCQCQSCHIDNIVWASWLRDSAVLQIGVRSGMSDHEGSQPQQSFSSDEDAPTEPTHYIQVSLRPPPRYAASTTMAQAIRALCETTWGTVGSQTTATIGWWNISCCITIGARKLHWLEP